MYTVVIQSEDTLPLSQDYRKMFFDEVIAQGELEFCTWIKSGRTIDTAVPSLYNLIAGKREWRAIIVQTERDRLTGPESCPANPFDYLDNRDQDQFDVEESDIPLIRLTHMLGGVPEPEVQFVPTEEKDEESGHVDRIIYKPVRNKEAIKKHKELMEMYQFVENRPKEILVISTRQPVDNTDAMIRAAWAIKNDSDASEFAYRNHYPASCRFITCDVLNEKHSLYNGCIFKLWLIVLLLAQNQVSPSSLQAYRLYDAELELDIDLLAEHFKNYRIRMGAMMSQLNSEEEQRVILEEEAAKEAPHIDNVVDVSFSAKDQAGLYVDTEEIGMTMDCPGNEYSFWVSGYHRASVALHELLRSPMRALDISADETRRKSVYPQDNVTILNNFQRLDMEEDQEGRYFEALEARSALGFDPKKKEKERKLIYVQVYNRICQRLSKGRALVGGAIGLGATLLGLIPFLVFTGVRDSSNIKMALLIVLGCILAAGIFGIIELWIQKKEMVDAFEDHNRHMRQTVKEVRESAGHYSDYLTALSEYMRGRSYLDREQELIQSKENTKRMRRAHRFAIKKCLSLIKVWSAALGVPVDHDGVVESHYSFDSTIPPEDNDAYRMESSVIHNQVPLNSTGGILYFPYDFVTGFSLEREELYDDVDSDRDD